MQLPSIGTLNHTERLQQRLDQELGPLKSKGIHIETREHQRGKIHFLDLILKNRDTGAGRDTVALVTEIVAKTLSDLIVDEMEAGIIRRILKESYQYVQRDEHEDLLSSVNREIESADSAYGLMMNKPMRKEHVLSKLVEYLGQDDHLVLEGFVRFRLKDYVAELEEAVERAVDDYVMEKEYGEFIRLLRYFVDTQEPRVDTISVVVAENGEFWLADRNGKKIENDQMDDLVAEVADGDIEYEDILVSNLITMAPARVVIHQPKDVEARGTYMETIKSVFGGRVQMCPGCPLCSKDMAQRTQR